MSKIELLDAYAVAQEAAAPVYENHAYQLRLLEATRDESPEVRAHKKAEQVLRSAVSAMFGGDTIRHLSVFRGLCYEPYIEVSVEHWDPDSHMRVKRYRILREAVGIDAKSYLAARALGKVAVMKQRSGVRVAEDNLKAARSLRSSLDASLSILMSPVVSMLEAALVEAEKKLKEIESTPMKSPGIEEMDD